MRIELIPLKHVPSGTSRCLRVIRFGTPQAGRKVYIQAALHADELPGVLVAHELASLLRDAEGRGELHGEVVLVPAANPIGLAQELMGLHHGRFWLADGYNFNRGFPELNIDFSAVSSLTPASEPLASRLKAAFRQHVESTPAPTESAALKAQLLQLAIDADIVLDLHCDGEALMHLYTLPQLASRFEPLAQLLGATVCLTASESGDSPFDEACSRPWQAAAAAFPEAHLEQACLACTVELRGERDISAAYAKHDAQAILDFLRIEGILSGAGGVVAQGRCDTLPLAGTEPLVAPAPGVLLFSRELGAMLEPGDEVARIVDPVTGSQSVVRAQIKGVLFAKANARWATAGKRIGKIAGSEVIRRGKLLSP